MTSYKNYDFKLCGTLDRIRTCVVTLRRRAPNPLRPRGQRAQKEPSQIRGKPDQTLGKYIMYDLQYRCKRNNGKRTDKNILEFY